MAHPHRPYGALISAALLLALAPAACDGPLGPDPRVPVSLRLVDGDGQTGTVGETLTDPLRVRVLDQRDRPLAGIPVAWSSDDAVLASHGAVTDSQGVARADLALGERPGDYQARAAVEGVGAVVFEATADPGPPAQVTASRESVVFTAVGDTVLLEAVVRDRFGNPVEGASVSWTSSDPAVVAVDPTGRAVAEGPGEAELAATAGEARAVVPVSVEQSVAAVVAGPAPDTLRRIGAEASLTATARDANGHVIPDPSFQWASLDDGVATVSAAGAATARGRGRTGIVVSAGVAADTIPLTVVPWGRVTVSMELNRWEIYDVVFPIMERHGLTGNIEVVLMYLGQDDRITLPEIREMHDAGWAVVPHTKTLPVLTELSDAELRDEVLGSQAWVRDQGFRGASTFPVPGHIAGEREMALIRDHFKAARRYGYLHVERMVDWPPADPYVITGLEGEGFLDSAAGRAELRTLWRQAIHEGRLLEIYFHRVKTSQASAFESFIRELAEYDRYVATFAELFPE